MLCLYLSFWQERGPLPAAIISAAEGSQALGGPTGDLTAMPGGARPPRLSGRDGDGDGDGAATAAASAALLSGGPGENGGEAPRKAPRTRGRPGAPSNERPRREAAAKQGGGLGLPHRPGAAGGGG